jgi:hypothetical protein
MLVIPRVPMPQSILCPTLCPGRLTSMNYTIWTIAVWLWLGLKGRRGKGIKCWRRERLGYLFCLLPFYPTPPLSGTVSVHSSLVTLLSSGCLLKC